MPVGGSGRSADDMQPRVGAGDGGGPDPPAGVSARTERLQSLEATLVGGRAGFRFSITTLGTVRSRP